MKSVMFLGAHPDDETVMAGGTLVMLRASDIKTHIICATDGRGGENGGVDGSETPVDLARMRSAELVCAAQALRASSVMRLPYNDPLMGPGEELYGFDADEDEFVLRIAGLLWVRSVDVVLTHGSNGEYGHPAHVQVHRAVLRAIREHFPHILLYTVAARMPGGEDRLENESDLAHVALDITPWIEEKHAAMLCHRTQHALFKRRRKLKTVREAIRTVESFHRHWPPVESDAPDDAFIRRVLAAGGWRPDHRAI